MWLGRTVFSVLFLIVTMQTASARNLLTSTLQFITGEDETTSSEPSGLSTFTPGATPDSVTETCLHCHDGTVISRMTSHPVGIDYDRRVREQPGEYRPRSALAPDIHLVNGKVSCVSCHRLTRDTPVAERVSQTLVAENDICPASKTLYPAGGRRDLCLSCHIK